MRERETRRKGRDRKGREEKRRILKEICKLQDPATQSTQKAKTYQCAQPPMEEERDKDLFSLSINKKEQIIFRLNKYHQGNEVCLVAGHFLTLRIISNCCN